ncbi:MAG: glycoside hydrolase, family [Bacteroidetes bacterium]|jgi:hypothetical protein|nr:glycoside hydrolase, family [Bacteroidota bacterium]
MKKNFILLIVFVLTTIISHSQNANWQQTTTPPGGSIWGLTAIGNDIFAGASNGGVYYSSDNGTTWQQRNGAYPGMQVYCITSLGSDLFVGAGSQVFKSSDLGLNWTEITPPGLNCDVRAILIEGNDIYIGTFGGCAGVMKSSLTNISSSTWNSFVNGFSNTIGGANIDVRSMAISGNNIIVGLYGHGVFTSPTSADNFTSISNGMGTYDDYIQAIAVKDSNFLAGNISGSPVMYRSSDMGTNWVQSNNSLFNNKPVYAIYAGDTSIYAGTEGAGVLLSNDNGVTWVDYNQGFKDSFGNWYCNQINVRAFVMVGTTLYAGTDCGVWKTANASQIVGINSNEASKNSLKLYPNPFNSSTTFRFNESINDGEILIYNSMGQKVKTISNVNGNSFELKNENLETGIYFYELIYSGKSINGKLIITE